ncbi:DUF2993 domain-containing protein [Streptomyces sp. NPDC059443]|uniref:LmeA family phospholipid-binding protein n=1 Tax=unclassified Streptomyces TaxID=2593676 RepID=UPI0036C47382
MKLAIKPRAKNPAKGPANPPVNSSNGSPVKSTAKSRRTRALVTAGIVTALACAVFVTDAVAAHSAQDRIARAAGCRLRAGGPVTADLGGTFAGLRALTGEVDSLHLEAQGVHRSGTEMRVEADLREVTRDGGVGGGRATATIPYGELQKRLAASGQAPGGASGLKVGGDTKGLTFTGTVGGLGLPVTVHADTSTTENSVTITPTTVSVFGRDMPISSLKGLPGTGGLTEQLAPRTVNIEDLPEGVRLTGARTTSAGLGLDVTVARTAAAPDGSGASADGGDGAGTGTRCPSA